MAIESMKNIKSTTVELRKFGITVGIVLGLAGGLFLLREKNYYSCFLIFSVVFLLLGLVMPITLKPVQRIWMSSAILIGWLITRIILILLFYLVVTPIGILAKIFGKHFLDIRFDENTDSYWIAREHIQFDKKSYENRF